MKNRVDQNDWRIYGSDRSQGNWNYFRSHLAKESAFAYLITRNRSYAQIADDNIRAIYDDPDPDQRLPDRNYGLSRAMVGSHMAIAYDWAYQGLTETQREFIKTKINEALDAWVDYQHGNLRHPLLASNWVAVCRGGELVMMLAVYEEENRQERYNQLKQWLKTHLINGYGKLGLSQEGIGYTSYAGTFLLPAVYALESVGDKELTLYLQELDFWRLVMYAGAFFMDKEYGERRFLSSGVSHAGIIDEGWLSLLLKTVPNLQLPFYRYFYDRITGIYAQGTAQQKFDDRRGATPWAIIYYPESAPSFDPTGIFSSVVTDYKRGAYFFRNRWQNENDILMSIMGDYDSHRNAWDQSEAFDLALLAYETVFMQGAMTNYGKPNLYSSLLINDQSPLVRLTGKSKSLTKFANGGYVIVDGGEKYQTLGIDKVERHLLVNFAETENKVIWTTLDKIADKDENLYTWQLNLGDDANLLNTETSKENGINIFTVRGENNSYLKGWVINPDDVQINTEDPLQVQVTAKNANIQ